MVLAAAIIHRDPGLRLNRIMGLIPICTAHWSLCEILWNLQDDPRAAAVFIRLSAFGWMLLGPVLLHAFSEMEGGRRIQMRRMVPISYNLLEIDRTGS